MIDKKIYVTKEGLEKLEAEYKHLKQQRKVIAERIHEAKELGDLSENAEYISAKEEQSFMESRIQELEQMLKNYVVITHNKTAAQVDIGSTISVKDDQGKIYTYTIVGSSESDPTNQKISNESPLGLAFLGHKNKDHVTVKTISGERVFEIMNIE